MHLIKHVGLLLFLSLSHSDLSQLFRQSSSDISIADTIEMVATNRNNATNATYRCLHFIPLRVVDVLKNFIILVVVVLSLEGLIKFLLLVV